MLGRFGRKRYTKKELTSYEPRIFVTCLALDRSDYYSKVLTLFRTIKTFGGRIANSNLVANFEQRVDPKVANRIKELGVQPRLVEPFDSQLKYANKIRMLETEAEYDVLFALDCDIAVAGDFFSQINPEFFQAKPVDQDLLSIEDWKNLFSFFGLELPKERLRTSFSQKETIPYFNSGVLSIPRIHVKNLRDSWAKYIKDISKSRSSFHSNVSEYIEIYLDQVALALALVSEKIPVKPYSLEMNFPTHHRIDPSLLPDNVEPFILHYHNRTSRGFYPDLTRKGLLLKTGYKKPDLAIKKINDLLKH